MTRKTERYKVLIGYKIGRRIISKDYLENVWAKTKKEAKEGAKDHIQSYPLKEKYSGFSILEVKKQPLRNWEKMKKKKKDGVT